MGAYSDRVIADGASYYWRLGETVGTTAVAAVGGVNGTISGGVTLGAAGALAGDNDKAMTFAGNTGQITTNGSVTIVPPCSIESWFYADPGAGTISIFATLTTSGSGGHLGIALAKPQTLHLRNTTTTVFVALGATVVDGLWHHLVWVLPGGTDQFVYLDGVAKSSPPLPVDQATLSRRLAIPEYGVIFSTGWIGRLDELAIYPRALTAAEIAAHSTLARQSVSWPGVPWWVQIQGDDALDNFNVWEPITPSNTVDLPRGVSGGIWVGSGGDVAAVMQNNVMPVVLAAVPTGAWLPIAAKRINATGTTATGLVALYEA